MLYINITLMTYLTSEAGRDSVTKRLEHSDCDVDRETDPQQGCSISFRKSSTGTFTLEFRRTW